MLRSIASFVLALAVAGVASTAASAQDAPSPKGGTRLSAQDREARRAEFLKHHPKIAEFLKATPEERAQKLDALAKDHPRLAMLFEKHPNLRTLAIEHPRAFRFAMRHPKLAKKMHAYLQAHPEAREKMKQRFESMRAERGR